MLEVVEKRRLKNSHSSGDFILYFSRLYKKDIWAAAAANQEEEIQTVYRQGAVIKALALHKDAINSAFSIG